MYKIMECENAKFIQRTVKLWVSGAEDAGARTILLSSSLSREEEAECDREATE